VSREKMVSGVTLEMRNACVPAHVGVQRAVSSSQCIT